VNLSGQAGNPFANTSWTPSVASNATKTVSDAQADRERRQLERQRQKAVGKIQKTWRGHRVRFLLADSRRSEFDSLQRSSSGLSNSELEASLRLLLAFANPQRPDDLGRVIQFVQRCNGVDVRNMAPAGVALSRPRRLIHLLVLSLSQAAKQEYVSSASLHPNTSLLTWL
jgi:ubiquitin-protein ligase E3 C